MVIDCASFEGSCPCGGSHAVETRRIVVEAGCLAGLDGHLAGLGLGGARVGLYDSNTYAALGPARPAMDREIVLDPRGLHPDEAAVARVQARLPEGRPILFAFGAGTITDIARFCAHGSGLPFVACPTAASVDGFCSSVAAMSFGGYKVTVPASAPLLVLADLDVISRAPPRLGRSGVGDLVGKHVALADWRVAELASGERRCARIAGMVAGAVRDVEGKIGGLASGEIGAYESLVLGLMLSGLAMQMNGDSRPASGAEHHLSHLLELGGGSLGLDCSALHGERVGVGSVLMSRLYRDLARVEAIPIPARDCAPMDEAWVRAAFGEGLGEAVIAENRDDCLRRVRPGRLAEVWPEIRAAVGGIPGPEELAGLLAGIGAPSSLDDLGVDPSLEATLVEMAPYVRNRLTLARMARLLKR